MEEERTQPVHRNAEVEGEASGSANVATEEVEKNGKYRLQNPSSPKLRQHSPPCNEEFSVSLPFPPLGLDDFNDFKPRRRRHSVLMGNEDRARLFPDLQDDPQFDKGKSERPSTFQCNFCPKKFTRAYNLRSHLGTHTENLSFVCGVVVRLSPDSMIAKGTKVCTPVRRNLYARVSSPTGRLGAVVVVLQDRML